MARSAPAALLIPTLTLVSLVARGTASSFLRSGQVSEEDAASALESELAASAGERLARLEDMLGPTYRSLPKNEAGNLGHQAVRYVLHRFFVQQHGWFIRGLEPNNNTWSSDARPLALKEWVPGYLQGLLEKRLGERGTSLRELAALAAALEDLARHEAVGRLKTAYEIHGLPVDEANAEPEVEEVATTYFMMYLLAGNFSASSMAELERKKVIFAKKYAGWSEAKAWLEGIVDSKLSPARNGVLDFAEVTGLVNEIGAKYYTFNDLECKSLKTTLQGMEGKKAGRVRLSSFYKKGLYSHWRFNEKAEYLRSLGALDETDPDVPRVIVPNYAMARTNCLEASRLYAICCRNECEDLLGHLERRLGGEAASPEQIAALVAELPSDTVRAPRNLSEALVGRLRQVALQNGGRVPLHGRLFAQWMHHAYPHECPYPHEAGKTNPQTPDEWMRVTGHANAEESAQEMLRHVERDTCASEAPRAGQGCGDEEDAELPWNEAEELLLVQSRPAAAVGDLELRAGPPWMDVCPAIAVAVALTAFLAIDYWRVLRRRHGSKEDLPPNEKQTSPDSWMVVPLSLLALATYLLDLLDGTMVAGAFCLGLACVSMRQLTLRQLGRRRPGSGKLPL